SVNQFLRVQSHHKQKLRLAGVSVLLEYVLYEYPLSYVFNICLFISPVSIVIPTFKCNQLSRYTKSTIWPSIFFHSNCLEGSFKLRSYKLCFTFLCIILKI